MRKTNLKRLAQLRSPPHPHNQVADAGHAPRHVGHQPSRAGKWHSGSSLPCGSRSRSHSRLCSPHSSPIEDERDPSRFLSTSPLHPPSHAQSTLLHPPSPKPTLRIPAPRAAAATIAAAATMPPRLRRPLCAPAPHALRPTLSRQLRSRSVQDRARPTPVAGSRLA